MPRHISYWKVLTRRKALESETDEADTKLSRVLGVFDLTALGVGSTLGAGVYVLAGQIAKNQAGPSVIISFAIAAVASLFAGLCYAEFGARVPKAGSAYTYSYVCIGEFAAFVIGWNLLLEYVIGAASVCRGISLYLDSVINDTLKITFTDIAPIEWTFLGSYFDFFAFGLAVSFGLLLAFGVETSTMLNNGCTLANIFVLLFCIVAGSFKANTSNWSIEPTANLTSTYNIGNGGFFPFGFEGTLKGAATCFFGFVGFDCIATTGEEVKNPRKNIPKSILYSLFIIFACYFGVSTVLTLMVPYYLQDPNAPIPFAFHEVGWDFAKWIVTVGGLIGLFASLLGALFPIPRILYSMAEDGLIFRFLGRVHPTLKTPVLGTVLASLLTGLISGVFDLAQLVNMLSIGTLLAYTMVAVSITILRFMDNSGRSETIYPSINPSENSMLTSNGSRVTAKSVLKQSFNFGREVIPNKLSTRLVGILLFVFCLCCMGCGLLIMFADSAIRQYERWALAILGMFVGLMLLIIISISVQPKEKSNKLFRVPLVPLIPAISIFVNIYLMLQLDAMTWIRFGVWMAFGLTIYFCYGLPNSVKEISRVLIGWHKLSLASYCSRSVQSALESHQIRKQELKMIAGGHGDPNPNRTWLSARGMWLAYILGVLTAHIILLSVPFVSIPMAWTITNLLHNAAHLYFLHSIKGAPWISTENSSAVLLTHWEQIDDGEQFTATRKFLTAFPIILFLLACLYTRNDTDHFIANFLSLVVVLLPKLPQFHGVRLFGINKY